MIELCGEAERGLYRTYIDSTYTRTYEYVEFERFILSFWWRDQWNWGFSGIVPRIVGILTKNLSSIWYFLFYFYGIALLK